MNDLILFTIFLLLIGCIVNYASKNRSENEQSFILGVSIIVISMVIIIAWSIRLG